MAILDFLVPDLAPEQYSSGQGTGYAQQYNLGAPNPFDVAQQYADKAVQTKKLELEKDLLNEKKRQEAFSKYITDIKYDPKWVIAESNFEQEVDDIGNFISEWRASGKPVNTEFQIELNKKKARLNSLKGMNDEAFTRYNKNMQTMLAGLGKDYEQKDINEYESEVKKAYEQGGVEAGFNKINQLRPLKEFDLIGYLKKDYPTAVNESGELLKTTPQDLDRMAKFKWDGLTDERKKEVMEKAYLSGEIKQETPEATIEYFRRQLDLWDQEVKARARVPRQTKSYGDKMKEKTQLVPEPMFDTSVRNDGFALSVPKSSEFYNTKGELVYIKPEWVTPKSGDGVVLKGKRLAKEGDRGYFETKEEADSAYEKWKKANSGKSASVEQDPETKKFIIVTGDEEYIPIGKGSNAKKNLGKFEAEYGYNLEDEFKKLAIELDKAENTKPGTWMDREFYGKSQGIGTTSNSGAARFNPPKKK